MRRVTMEFNYQRAWKEILGSNADKVEVIEALRCFKCDTQGLALICRIRLKDKSVTVTDLLHKGLITNIETLYTEKDGSVVVFIEGKSCVPPPPKDMKLPKMLKALRRIITRRLAIFNLPSPNSLGSHAADHSASQILLIYYASNRWCIHG